MRLAVISDVHGNLEAFHAVLKDVERNRADGILNLGDQIGYGPDPEEVSRLVRGLGIPSVVGNHDLAVLDLKRARSFTPLARDALSITASLISKETEEYLSSLPVTIRAHGALFVHGTPPASVGTYLFMVPDHGLKTLIEAGGTRLSFVGHTHELALVELRGGEILRRPLGEETITLDPEASYIVNVGSVGQPRDGTPEAKYCLWDTEAGRLKIRFVPYDYRKTQAKLLERGFPGRLARRLGP